MPPLVAPMADLKHTLMKNVVITHHILCILVNVVHASLIESPSVAERDAHQ